MVLERPKIPATARVERVLEPGGKVSAQTVVDLEVAAIEIPTWNPRKSVDEAALAELAEDVRARGVLSPILVRPAPNGAGFELVAGQRRLLACRRLGLERVPAVVRNLADVEAAEASLAENMARQDLSPIEEARAFQHLVEDLGASPEALAARMGRAPGFVAGRLALLRLPLIAQDAVAGGRMALRVAYLCLRIPGQVQAAAIADALKAAADGVGAGQLERELQGRYMLDLEGAGFDLEDPSLVEAAGACTTCPNRTSNQRALFGALEGDRCADPACFRAKRDAEYTRVAARVAAGAPGAPATRVLEGEAAAGIFYAHGGVHHSWRDVDQALGGKVDLEAVPVYLAQDPATGRPRRLVRARDVARAERATLAAEARGARQARKAAAPEAAAPAPGPDVKAERQAARQAARAALEAAALEEAFGALAEQVALEAEAAHGQGCDPVDAPTICGRLLALAVGLATEDDAAGILRRRTGGSRKVKLSAWAGAYIRGESDALGMVAELIARARARQAGGDLAKIRRPLLPFGVDVAKIKAALKGD